MDKMTNGERVSYAHGRIKSDIDDIRETVVALHHDIQTAYNAWLTVLISGATILVMATIPFWIFPSWQWWKFVYVPISLLVFLLARLVSYHKIRDVRRISKLVDVVIHALSNSETLHIGFEDMQQRNKEQKSKDDAARVI